MSGRAAIDLADGDSGLRCPQCEYNLTGLTQPRCPECGTAFAWDQVHRAADLAPRIAFERARGMRKIPAFALTWLTVLFAPWVFARQAVQRIGAGHAAVFGAVCFAAVVATCVWHKDTALLLTWLATALICIGAQSLGLALVDPHFRGHGWRTLRFWLLVAGYTSAIMITEVVEGPVIVGVSESPSVLQFVLIPLSDSPWLPERFFTSFFRSPIVAKVFWLQVMLWLTGLSCCYFTRLRARAVRRSRALGATIVVSAGLLFLYAALVEYVGAAWLYPLFERLLP